ncbi:MAG TPA: Gfo/Idh/MocA family oxidoreductase [Conexivisphaerales archaeon]|nr:Gfo/Idh/MocA family oxidoreductase [Conexivisphaerales archaeon]
MPSVGLVGVGGWGKNHARVLGEMGVLKAVCDVDAARAASFARRYGCPSFTSVDEMLSSTQLDAVHVCTPTVTHAQVAKRLLESGLSVFVEKPLAATTMEGEMLATLADEKKKVLAVGFIERFNPVVAYLKDLVSKGRMGELLLAEFHRESRWGGIKDVGILKDTTVHDIDTARWIFAEEPVQVFARTGRVRGRFEDFAVVVLGFKGHRSAILTSNWVTPKKERMLEAVFTEGVVTLNFVTQEVRIDSETNTEIPRLQAQEPLAAEIRSFLDCVATGRKPLVDGWDAIKTSKIAEAAGYSSERGLPVFLHL